MDFGLSGRSALVMGASKGLGFAVARELAAEGVKIAICARDEARLKGAAERLGATALVGDLRQPGAGRRLVEQAAASLGSVDILVVNTGGPATMPFESISSEDWRGAFEGLFMSATNAIGAAIPGMRERNWGRILLVTSIAAKEPINNFTISNALRAGLHGLTKTLSREFAANGITVNALMPGYTMTERLAEAKLDLQKVAGMIPMGRIGEPEEFAALATFLASDRASYITGQAIACDGGALWSI
ncbi:3-oxoacyl-[acyl-carrier protein] reductase [Mesorhizobium soli]|uniref:SDR family oxidoreductase n=1 Tax=Pseudaminobacter soli (ex Li et al. 2025) TaxID=1295366 RepID=UPI002473B5EC|nr:SDR family oxidoreductase [Mesorhizobium soli]MDH6231828.1 3-oxoacyl-[acyl-carrier protein] reductase [Mesorhizobium soli]